MTEEENPRIRALGDLLEENFFVPRYQRGYRWGEQEITELLEDILQYQRLTSDRENKVSKFYCLQPIVVKRKKWKTLNNGTEEELDGWELIDGQQRLTTIYLILSYLSDIRQLINNGDTRLYTIDFETRGNCKIFFENKDFAGSIKTSNVDFYHISMAYIHIKKWFEESNKKVEVLKTILAEEYNVAIIWYETQPGFSKENQDDNSIDLFTRLNEGKIPLTDAELIKALILQSDQYPEKEERFIKQRLFEIASEWDEIEASLQDEKMWLFLNDTKYQPSSKIEFIFSLLAEKWNEQLPIPCKIDKSSRHFEYLVFDRFLSAKKEDFKKQSNLNKNTLDAVNEIWEEIKENFSFLSEWYLDHTAYHYIGFLIAINHSAPKKLIQDLIAIKQSKKEFIYSLRIRIAEEIHIKKRKDNSLEFKNPEDLSYGVDNTEILKILMLLNIETLLKHKKENARFPFHLFKQDKISSLEHIHPQNPEDITIDEERSKTWLSAHQRTLTILSINNIESKESADLLIEEIKILLVEYNKERFKILYSRVIDLYTQISQIKENEIDTLYNLALVDKDTNSSLNNSFFDIKREILKENKSEKYIPICTQRVFDKYYSSTPQEMIFWGDSDRKAYFNSIQGMYNSFMELLEQNK